MNDQTAIRQLPHNVGAEQAVLGALLLNNLVAERIGFLKPGDFFDPLHGQLFEAIITAIDRGEGADPVTLRTHFDVHKDYLANLMVATASVISAIDYARVIKDCANRRSLLQIAEDAERFVTEAPIDHRTIDFVSGVQARLDQLIMADEQGGPKALGGVLIESAAHVAAMRQRGGGLLGLSTGLYDLDQILGGLAPGDVTVLGGSTSMGKTALALFIADAAAHPLPEHGTEHGPVLYFSFEMRAQQLGMRVLGIRSHTAYSRMRRGQVNEEELSRIANAAALEAPPLYIDDTPFLSPRAVRSRARALQRQRGLRLIVIDYLQLMRANRPTGDRLSDITSISNDMKRIAMELDVPIILLSQLSRAHANREDKRPILPDLRESGAIEQDADCVVFVYRDHKYHPEPPKDAEGRERWFANKNIIEAIVAKQRNGDTGTVRIGCQLETNRLWSLGSPQSSQREALL